MGKIQKIDRERLAELVSAYTAETGHTYEDIEGITDGYPSPLNIVTANQLGMLLSGKQKGLSHAKVLSLEKAMSVKRGSFIAKNRNALADVEQASDASLEMMSADAVSGVFQHIVKALIDYQQAEPKSAQASDNDLATDMFDGNLIGRQSQTLGRKGRFDENIAKIVMGSLAYIPPDFSRDERLNQDWVDAFREYAERVSDDDLKELWEQILAGQFTRQSDFSLRTLRIVQDLTMDIAKDFEISCGSIFEVNGDYLSLRVETMGGTKSYLGYFGLDFSRLTDLSEYGLVTLGSVAFEEKEGSVFSYGDQSFIAKEKIKFRANPLTGAGREIYKLIRSNGQIKRSKKYFEMIFRLNRRRAFVPDS